MKKEQKRTSVEATFAFGETELSYSLRYGSSIYEVVTDYFEIIPQRKFVARRDWSRFRFGVLLALVGFAAMAAQTFVDGAHPVASLWLAPALMTFAAFIFSRNHFRVFQASGNPVWIIEGEDSADIIAEIQLRRRNRIATVYGPLNLSNEPELEINKIEWLVLEAVFTRDQADKQIALVHADVAEKTAAAAAAAEEAAGSWAPFAREAIAI